MLGSNPRRLVRKGIQPAGRYSFIEGGGLNGRERTRATTRPTTLGGGSPGGADGSCMRGLRRRQVMVVLRVELPRRLGLSPLRKSWQLRRVGKECSVDRPSRLTDLGPPILGVMLMPTFVALSA